MAITLPRLQLRSWSRFLNPRLLSGIVALLIIAWFSWKAIPQLLNPPVSANEVVAKLIRVKSTQLETLTTRLEAMRTPAASQPFAAGLFIKGSTPVSIGR